MPAWALKSTITSERSAGMMNSECWLTMPKLNWPVFMLNPIGCCGTTTGAGVKPPSDAPRAYAIVPDAMALPAAMKALDALRAAGVTVVMNAGGGSMKSQFKRADASGAGYALIFGAEEIARGEVAIKPLRDPAAAQFSRALADAASWARELKPSRARP